MLSQGSCWRTFWHANVLDNSPRGGWDHFLKIFDHGTLSRTCFRRVTVHSSHCKAHWSGRKRRTLEWRRPGWGCLPPQASAGPWCSGLGFPMRKHVPHVRTSSRSRWEDKVSYGSWCLPGVCPTLDLFPSHSASVLYPWHMGDPLKGPLRADLHDSCFYMHFPSATRLWVTWEQRLYLGSFFFFNTLVFGVYSVSNVVIVSGGQHVSWFV